MTSEFSIDASRGKLLDAIGASTDVVFVRGYGNIGDDLIYAGTRQLLVDVEYREVSVTDLETTSGELGLLSGSGAWCATYHAMPPLLAEVESRFDRVIVLPSSFDLSGVDVRQALEQTEAKVFARERTSFEQIRNLCDADLAHDTALYFDYQPYNRRGAGVLTAYRTDPEAVRHDDLPHRNNDISETCGDLDEWLWTIARHELIRTDRAHVTIAGAMLGKRVEYASSNYHKVPAIVEFSLQGKDVERVERERSTVVSGNEATSARRARGSPHATWVSQIRRAKEEIESLIPEGDSFIFVDDDQSGTDPFALGRTVIPFLERDGAYNGSPPDDLVAIDELERLRADGASFIVFLWTAFWWLDHYSTFVSYLEATYRTTWRNERLVAIDLR